MFSYSTIYFLYLLAHFCAFAAIYLFMRQMLINTVQPRKHAIIFALVYLCCNFIIAKILFDLFNANRPFAFFNGINPAHYFEPGFWGWMLAFLPLSVLYPFFFKLNRSEFFRTLALALPVVIFFQKMGCLAAGCCVGVESHLPWCFAYPTHWGSSIYGPPVHPVPIYDAVLMLILLLALRAMDRKETVRPYLYPIFLLLYSLSRFMTEMLRPISNEHLSSSQLFELATMALALALLTVGRKPWLSILEQTPK
jgi:prolipoprotein diacylglyceryltransferase